MPLHDTRLLSNLIKTEKDAQASFKTWMKDASSAGSALSAWSVADSGNTKDLMDISVRISQLLSACTDSQRVYLHSLSAYRTSLKDVLDREMSLRTIVRDREILVGRLIKLGNKKPTDSGFDSHSLKLEDAQRELAACESFLHEEEAALTEAKRRTFREALALRMRSMGDLGKVMEQSASEAITLLLQLGQGSDIYERGSAAGDSITPSNSASQAVSRTSSASSSIVSLPDFSTLAPHQISNGSTPHFPLAMVPYTSPNERRASSSTQRAKPLLLPVPQAPRPLSSYNSTSEYAGPSFDIPKAPAHVMSRGPNADSSDDDDDERTIGHGDNRNSTVPNGRLRRRAHFDTSSITDRGKPKKGGFFGGLASLFKKRDRTDSQSNGSAGGFNNRPLRTVTSTEWETRTDRNVSKMVGIGAGQNRANGGVSRREEYATDSDQDDMPKNLVRVVNDPKARMKAMSDVGVVPSSKPRLEKKRTSVITRAASDLGTSTPPSIAEGTIPKRKKKISTTSKPSQYSLAPPANLSTPTIATTNTLRPFPTSPQMSRSNTVTSIRTTGTTGTTDTVKRRKKRVSTLTAPPAIPTAADLSASLPSARASMILYSNTLPSPYTAEPDDPNAGKIPKSLARSESRSKKDLARYSNGNWVATPTHSGSIPKIHVHPHQTGGVTPAVRKMDVEASRREESLMSIVDRDEKEARGVEETSRSYGGVGRPRDLNTLSAGLGPVTVAKRKSVRLAEGSTVFMENVPSPPSSVRSDPSHSTNGTPRHGILTNSSMSNGNGSGSHSGSNVASGSTSTWTTRVQEEDSSDDEDAIAYKAAMKSFGKATKGFSNAMEDLTGKEKGKGREV